MVIMGTTITLGLLAKWAFAGWITWDLFNKFTNRGHADREFELKKGELDLIRKQMEAKPESQRMMIDYLEGQRKRQEEIQFEKLPEIRRKDMLYQALLGHLAPGMRPSDALRTNAASQFAGNMSNAVSQMATLPPPPMALSSMISM